MSTLARGANQRVGSGVGYHARRARGLGVGSRETYECDHRPNCPFVVAEIRREHPDSDDHLLHSSSGIEHSARAFGVVHLDLLPRTLLTQLAEIAHWDPAAELRPFLRGTSDLHIPVRRPGTVVWGETALSGSKMMSWVLGGDVFGDIARCSPSPFQEHNFLPLRLQENCFRTTRRHKWAVFLECRFPGKGILKVLSECAVRRWWRG